MKRAFTTLIFCLAICVELLAAELPGILHPVGSGVGIWPGRVVWVHRPGVVTAPKGAPDWFSDRYIDGAGVRDMMSEGLLRVTGASEPADAWARLFEQSNRLRHRGDVGYVAGERIAIKIEGGHGGSHYNTPELTNTPQLVEALVRSLIRDAGVKPECITVSDPSGWLTDSFFERLTALSRNIRIVDGHGGWKRIESHWVSTAAAGPRIEESFADAEYTINVAMLNQHQPSALSWRGALQGSPALSGAELVSHPDLGTKCLLTVVDGLLSAGNDGKASRQWHGTPFEGEWPSSLLLSVDPVAIDAVSMDMLATQGLTLTGGEHWLAEGAQLGLGTAEHWRRQADPLYSRNLGRERGIELVYSLQAYDR